MPLEPKAYELLSLLVERRPRGLSRAQIRDVTTREERIMSFALDTDTTIVVAGA